MFTLKGKPLNVWDLKRDIVYKNDQSNFITRQRRRVGGLGRECRGGLSGRSRSEKWRKCWMRSRSANT
jgi:hypothetical protein